MREEQVSVLIVGAGLAGLSTALTLAQRGARPLIIERHRGFSAHPRARGLNMRSMELLRTAGLEEELCSVSAGTFGDFTIIHAATVTGPAQRTIVQRGAWEVGLSPARSSGMVQSHVEPILARRATQLGAELRFATELLQIEQSRTHVRALVRDRNTGEEYAIRAQYLVGADGHRSTVRELLAIGVTGTGLLSSHIAIIFTADRELPGHSIFYLRQKDLTAAFIHMDDSGISVLSVEVPATMSMDEATPQWCLDQVHKSLGSADHGVHVSDVMRYDMASFVANRFSAERVHLVGDAAHTMPPIGGLGGQAAIQDGFDIGWKLDLALRGIAGPALLRSYAAERRPVAELTVQHQTDKYFQRMRPDKMNGAPGPQERCALGIAYGYRYRSSCLLGDELDDAAAFQDPATLDGRPGTRVPFAALERDGKPTSLLDQVGGGFVLASGPRGQAWIAAARRLAKENSLPLTTLHLSTDAIDPEGTWTRRHGIGHDGAILMRPDGFVAWRSSGVHDEYRTLRHVMSVVLGKAAAQPAFEQPELRDITADRPEAVEETDSEIVPRS
ncbi:MAG: FAD-dependent oxidoreductase [Steroidobacteraceae bacterium]